jgi:hypothetical protein
MPPGAVVRRAAFVNVQSLNEEKPASGEPGGRARVSSSSTKRRHPTSFQTSGRQTAIRPLMISWGEIVSWLVQTAVAAGVAATAFFVLLPTKIGEKYLSFHFDRKLADLKDAQNQKIEALKEQLSHFGDRGKRSNER